MYSGLFANSQTLKEITNSSVWSMKNTKTADSLSFCLIKIYEVSENTKCSYLMKLYPLLVLNQAFYSYEE